MSTSRGEGWEQTSVEMKPREPDIGAEVGDDLADLWAHPGVLTSRSQTGGVSVENKRFETETRLIDRRRTN